jgi:hypothetical protein
MLQQQHMAECRHTCPALVYTQLAPHYQNQAQAAAHTELLGQTRTKLHLAIGLLPLPNQALIHTQKA